MQENEVCTSFIIWKLQSEYTVVTEMCETLL